MITLLWFIVFCIIMFYASGAVIALVMIIGTFVIKAIAMCIIIVSVILSSIYTAVFK